jgi:hypothetical protein
MTSLGIEVQVCIVTCKVYSRVRLYLLSNKSGDNSDSDTEEEEGGSGENESKCSQLEG